MSALDFHGSKFGVVFVSEDEGVRAHCGCDWQSEPASDYEAAAQLYGDHRAGIGYHRGYAEREASGGFRAKPDPLLDDPDEVFRTDHLVRWVSPP